MGTMYPKLLLCPRHVTRCCSCPGSHEIFPHFIARRLPLGNCCSDGGAGSTEWWEVGGLGPGPSCLTWESVWGPHRDGPQRHPGLSSALGHFRPTAGPKEPVPKMFLVSYPRSLPLQSTCHTPDPVLWA